MRATKLVPVITIKHLKYKDRLQRLKLPTLQFRRIRGDMIEVYKILTCTCRYCKNVNLHLELHQDNITSGHSLSWSTRDIIMIRESFHFQSELYIWNSLSASVNSANNVNTFKNRLDRFWTNQELMYITTKLY